MSPSSLACTILAMAGRHPADRWPAEIRAHAGLVGGTDQPTEPGCESCAGKQLRRLIVRVRVSRPVVR